MIRPWTTQVHSSETPHTDQWRSGSHGGREEVVVRWFEELEDDGRFSGWVGTEGLMVAWHLYIVVVICKIWPVPTCTINSDAPEALLLGPKTNIYIHQQLATSA